MDDPVRALHDTLEDLPEPPAVAIAFSGGRDSTALLHAAVAVRDAGLVTGLRALHVEHGLHPEAPHWRDRCAAFCSDLEVPFTALAVAAEAAKGESPEAAAREARYAALAAELGPGEWLLTAHHRDDQAETLLLQLLRGSGVAGLAAMPARSPFASGWLVRPLLELDRASLAAYASDHRLDWCEDPSNAAIEHDRNFLRHEIMPRLASRWPAVTDCLARSAAHCAEADGLLDELAGRELSALALSGQPEVLPVDGLLALPADRRRLLLRHWLVTLGLPRPGHRVLARIEREALVAAPDRNPVVSWSGGEVRRHRNTLHARVPAAYPDPTPLPWDPADELELPWGVLAAEAVTGAGLAQARLRGQRLTVRTRTGGERLRLPGRPTRTLKKLLQEAGVPTWRRAGLPLVYVGEELAAVADLWIAEGYEANDGVPGWRLQWHETDPPGMPEKCVFD
jgi:tRNA(Ile)-lysidine synthase